MSRLRLLESAVPLSRSMIWPLMARFYEHEGIDAWARGVVPYWVTTTPAMARAYAEIVVAWLEDGVDDGTIDPSHPVTVVELGGGAGILAHRFLHQLDALAPTVPVRYLLTDLAAKNVDFWREHPSFAAPIAAGRLRVQALDPVTSPLPDVGPNPPVILANYLLCSLPCDMFRARGGALQEGLVITSCPKWASDPPLPKDLRHFEVEYHWDPLRGPRYRDDRWQALLDAHAGLDGAFAFPTAALSILDRLDRALVLVADKGTGHPEALCTGQPEYPAVHGSLSFWLDLWALGRHVEAGGGFARHNAKDAALGLALLGLGTAAAPRAEAAFAAWTGERDPSRLLHRWQDPPEGHVPTATELADLLEVSQYDPHVVRKLFDGVRDGLLGTPRPIADRIVDGLARAWPSWFWLGEPVDVPWQFGEICRLLSRPDAAVPYFEASITWFGDSPRTRASLAACHEVLEGASFFG